MADARARQSPIGPSQPIDRAGASSAREPASDNVFPRESEVQAAARADAANEAPGADAASPSAMESEIVAALERARRRLLEARAAAAAEAARAMRAGHADALDFASVLAQARLRFGQIEGRAGPESREAHLRARRAKEDLEGFRRANNLRRVAIYPASSVLQAGLLFCAALFEALFSATLFAQESEQGLLGGAAVAVGLSGANVTLGFLAGFLGLRYLQPMRLLPRIGGAVAFAVFLGLAAALNWFAALWRQTLSYDPDARIDPLAPALDLFGFTEPQAVVLLMLGAGVWVFSALKGYSGFDDPYPDYGKMSRAARDAEEAMADLRAEVREGLEDAAEAAQSEITDALEARRKAAAATRAHYDAAAQEIAACDARIRRLEDAAANLIHLYRQENLAARQTPPPAYFADPPPFALAREDALAAAGQEMSRAQSVLAEAEARAAAALQALAEHLEAASARLNGDAESAAPA